MRFHELNPMKIRSFKMKDKFT